MHRILFGDDNEINVKGAREIGLNAKQVKGVEEFKEYLKSIGILDGADKNERSEVTKCQRVQEV